MYDRGARIDVMDRRAVHPSTTNSWLEPRSWASARLRATPEPTTRIAELELGVRRGGT
ncbi:MAG: hypothetical protein ACK52I_19090 [Pseudomonadota bacterium]